MIGIELVPEISEGWPLETGVWIGTEVSIEEQAPFVRAHAQLVIEWVKELYPVARTFGERNAMPGIFARAILARFALACPSGNLQLRSTWCQPGLKEPVFHGVHELT